jgi:hypothetical protein
MDDLLLQVVGFHECVAEDRIVVMIEMTLDDCSTHKEPFEEQVHGQFSKNVHKVGKTRTIASR